jgi:hypothetical protein
MYVLKSYKTDVLKPSDMAFEPLSESISHMLLPVACVASVGLCSAMGTFCQYAGLPLKSMQPIPPHPLRC